MGRCVKCGQKFSGPEKECPGCGVALNNENIVQEKTGHSRQYIHEKPAERITGKKINPLAAAVVAIILFAVAVYYLPKYGDYRKIRQAVEDYNSYIGSMDGRGLMEMASAKAGLEMEKSGGLTAERLELLKAMHPPDSAIRGVKLAQERASVLLGSSVEGFGGAAGILKLVRENGVWKIEKIDWKMTIGGAESYGGIREIVLHGILPAPPLKKIPAQIMAETDFYAAVSTAVYSVRPEKPEMITEFTEFENPLLEFSRDGSKLLAAGYGNYRAGIFNTEGWSAMKNITMNNRPVSAAVLQDSFVISDAYGGFTTVRTMPGEGGPSRSSPDGSIQLHITAARNSKYIAAYTFNKKLSFYSVEKMEPVSVNKTFMPPVTCGAFLPGGNFFFAGTNSTRFMIWNLEDGRGKTYNISKVSGNSAITSLSFSPDGKYFVTTHTDSSVVLFDTETQKELKNFYVNDKGAMCSAFSPDGRFFATGHDGGWVYFWSIPEAAKLAAHKLHDGIIMDMKFMPGKPYLATAAYDHKIRVWDMH